jgi:hypothetical protein
MGRINVAKILANQYFYSHQITLPKSKRKKKKKKQHKDNLIGKCLSPVGQTRDKSA